ncbi:unnamed protein product, partial [Pelagomonas calceolata]
HRFLHHTQNSSSSRSTRAVTATARPRSSSTAHERAAHDAHAPKSTMTAKDDTVASKAEEEFVLLGDPEKTTALPDLPRTPEPADKQVKTIVAETLPPRATHAVAFEAALKEAAPDAPPTIGDAAAALKDATLRELGAAREKASTKIKAAARAARRNAPAWRRVGYWTLGLLALAVVFTSGFFLGDRRSRVASAPTQVSEATTPAADAPVAETVKSTPPTTSTGSPTCRARPSVDSLFDGVVNEILGLRSQPRPRRAEPLDAFVRRMLAPAPRVLPTMDVSFGWPGLELTVPFLRREAEQQRRLDAAVAARHQAANVQRRRLEEQRRLEHARHEAAHNRQALEEQRRLERARHEAARRQAQKAAAVKDLEERLAKAEAAREERLRLAEQRTTEPMPVADTDVVETNAVDAEPAVEPTPAPTRPARDALRELSIKQLRNILASRGGACTTCKEKDDLVAAVIKVLDD